MKQRSITKEEFDRLLAWLDPDAERAGARYEVIRRGLIDMFIYRGCATPEDLADETINRVAHKLGEIVETYEGDPKLYFYGVAKRLFYEYIKEKPPEAHWHPHASEMPEEMERRLACLDRCIERLTPDNSELILDYYREQKRAKIDVRKRIGERLNLKPTALRVRVHRIREQLEKCVRECLAERAGGNESGRTP